jgi:hypothetical protein
LPPLIPEAFGCVSKGDPIQPWQRRTDTPGVFEGAGKGFGDGVIGDVRPTSRERVDAPPKLRAKVAVGTLDRILRHRNSHCTDKEGLAPGKVTLACASVPERPPSATPAVRSLDGSVVQGSGTHGWVLICGVDATCLCFDHFEPHRRIAVRFVEVARFCDGTFTWASVLSLEPALSPVP